MGPLLVYADDRLSYVPFVSFVINLVDVIEKVVLDIFISLKWVKSNEIQNRYLIHLQYKKYKTCGELMVPFYNIYVAIQLEKKHREVLNSFFAIDEIEEKETISDYFDKWVIKKIDSFKQEAQTFDRTKNQENLMKSIGRFLLSLDNFRISYEEYVEQNNGIHNKEWEEFASQLNEKLRDLGSRLGALNLYTPHEYVTKECKAIIEICEKIEQTVQKQDNFPF